MRRAQLRLRRWWSLGGLLPALLLVACDLTGAAGTPTPLPTLTPSIFIPQTAVPAAIPSGVPQPVETVTPPPLATATPEPPPRATVTPVPESPLATVTPVPEPPGAVVPTAVASAPPESDGAPPTEVSTEVWTAPPTEPPTAAPTAPPPPTPARVPPTARPPRRPSRTPTRQPTPPPPGDPGRVAGDLSAISRGLPGKRQVALTFDAGMARGQSEEILRVLREHQVHITFFLTGKWIEENPNAARAIAAEGHEIANHTYSHPSFFDISDAQMIAELDRAEALIQEVTGQTARPYWRAPYGATNQQVDEVGRGHGYRNIMWTLDSLDSVGKPKTADFIYNRICNSKQVDLDGAIILQHMAAPASVEALPRILDTLAERGWQVVTLTELLTP